MRYRAIISDQNNPISQLIVRVNHNDAAPFFEALIRRLQIPGRVEAR